MSLRGQVVLYLSLVVVSYAALDHGLQQLFFLKSFQELEHHVAQKDVERVVKAVEEDVFNLNLRATAWSASDDLYEHVEVRSPRYEAAELGLEALRKNALDLLYVVDRLGRVVHCTVADENGVRRRVPLRDFPTDQMSINHPLLMLQATYEDDSGVWITESGPMLISVKPILKSDRSGPIRGTLILGRLLSDRRIEELTKRTGVTFETFSVAGEVLSPEERRLLPEIQRAETAYVREVDELSIHAYGTMPDLEGNPALLVRANIAREVSDRGSKAVRYATLSNVAAGCVILLVLLKLLQHTVLSPIAELTQYAVEVGHDEDTPRKLALDRKDEIGILSREFDRMLEKLARSRQALVKAARAAGMSEIATGVLHNVGNVLNSVNVSASIVYERARANSLADLKLALQMVRESCQDLAGFMARDARAPHLQPLLEELVSQLGRDHEEMVGETRRMGENIEHIKLLIQSQQDYAGRPGISERVSVEDLLESALSITSETTGVGEVRIVRELEPMERIPLDRHRVLEILVNLLQNARQALSEPGVSERTLTLRTRRPAPDQLVVEVEDTGVGIAPENLARVFTHGFTTKKHGHGFGLHSSANAATELGGKITAHSEGTGRGARFVLELPIAGARPARVTS